MKRLQDRVNNNCGAVDIFGDCFRFLLCGEI